MTDNRWSSTDQLRSRGVTHVNGCCILCGCVLCGCWPVNIAPSAPAPSGSVEGSGERHVAREAQAGGEGLAAIGQSLLSVTQSAIENAQLIAAELGGNLDDVTLTTEIGRAEVLLMQLRAVRRLVQEIGAVGEQASEIGSEADANGMAGRPSDSEGT